MRLSGTNLAYFTKNTTFTGFNQRVQVDTAGDVKTTYVILDSDNRGGQLYQTYLVDLTSGGLRFAGRSIRFPGGLPPPSDSSCWFEKDAVCTGGKEKVVNIGACGYVWMCLLKSSLFYVLHTFPSSYLLSSSGVEVTYIIVVFAVISTLAVAGLVISLYIRYTHSSFQSNKLNIVFLSFTVFLTNLKGFLYGCNGCSV